MTLTKEILDFAGKDAASLEETERVTLLQACEKLALALETPLEKFIRLFFNLYDPVVIRIAVDLNLVDIALAHNGPITAAELALKSKADVELIYRILRLLVALDIFVEASHDNEKDYTPAPFGHVLATGSPLRSGVLHISHCFPATAFMPDYFAANGYQNPVDARDGPFAFAYQCKGETYFDYLSRSGNERMATAFNETMALQKSGEEVTFVSSYPVRERLSINESERVLFVDVGGGVGHQLLKFRERATSLVGKYVLEDLLSVLAQANDLPEEVVRLGHDFFQPQPPSVHGAKSFYLRMILHDWPQTQALDILRNIVAAMASDSVVLIHEIIMPESEVSHFEAKMDWHLMNLGASERTEKQWRTLVAEVGLEIKGIWWEEEGMKGRRALLECGLKC